MKKTKILLELDLINFPFYCHQISFVLEDTPIQNLTKMEAFTLTNPFWGLNIVKTHVSRMWCSIGVRSHSCYSISNKKYIEIRHCRVKLWPLEVLIHNSVPCGEFCSWNLSRPARGSQNGAQLVWWTSYINYTY